VAPDSLATGQPAATLDPVQPLPPPTIELNTTHQSHSTQLIKLQAKINGLPATVLVDCGASDNFGSLSFLAKAGVKLAATDLSVTMADGTQHCCQQTASKIPIRIGRYKEKLHLQAMPLEQCDIILGKRWLSTHNPSVDWQANTLSFVFKGENIHLKAVPDPQPASASNLLLSALQLQRAVKKGSNLFVALVRTTDTSDTSTSDGTNTAGTEKLTLEIVSEYSDVFPDQLPKGLPPSREVDHAIELEPGDPRTE
jgi:hypothetical protein